MKFIKVPYAVQCPQCAQLMRTKMVAEDQVKVHCFTCGYKQKYLLPLDLSVIGES